MKKKKVLLICTLLSFSLTACGGEESGNTTNTASVEQEITVQEIEDENSSENENATNSETETDEAVTSSENESVENSDSETGSGESGDTQEAALPDREALSEMFTAFINWSGFQYIYEPVNVDTLTAAQAVPMAAHVAGFFNNDLEQTDEGQVVIPQDLLEATMEDYFGKTFAVSDAGELTLENSMVSLDKDGTVLLHLGDWGLKGPRFEIKDISLADDGSEDVIAVVEYGTYDLELGEDILTGYNVTYRLAPMENTKYGFVITDMQAVQE